METINLIDYRSKQIYDHALSFKTYDPKNLFPTNFISPIKNLVN